MLCAVVAAVAVSVGACGSDAEPRNERISTADTRDEVDCDAEALGEDDQTEFVTAHFVVDGKLGAMCFGEEDPTMAVAWDQLVAITPPGQLTDLGLFAGFIPAASEDDEADTTLAFVNVIDDEGTAFQMSVNLDAFDDDPDEARLTLAHEFSHVFTSTSTQLDRSPEAVETCATHFSGEGCYLPDSLMAEWIDVFWDPGELASIDPNREAEVDDGAERCATDPSFLGPYAASTPEEDFAESFSAFVFEVEAPTDEVQAKLDWFADQPGLLEFQDRAIDARLGPLVGSFEGCGG